MKRAATKIRVMVVNDHPVVRFGLLATFAAQPDFTVVVEAGSGEEAIELFRRRQPDVCLHRLRLTNFGGAEVIRALRKDFPASVFIVLTT